MGETDWVGGAGKSFRLVRSLLVDSISQDMNDQAGSSRRRTSVWLVLPAYDEEASLAELLERIDEAMFEAQLPFRVVIVDDGSRDDTLAIARSAQETLPVEIVIHEVNLGLGAAIRDGLLYAIRKAHPRDVIVTLDSDNTHTPDLILRMVRMVREGHDVVIASRYRPGSRVRGVPLVRQVLSLGASWLLRVLFPTPGVRDYTSGYRAYRASVMQEVIAREGEAFFDQDGFQVMVDILLKLRRDPHLIFGEAPLILRYDLKEGASKMDVGSTIQRTLALVIRRRFGGWR